MVAVRRRFLARPERLSDHALDLAIVAAWTLALGVDDGRWWSRAVDAVAGGVNDGVLVTGACFAWYLFVFWSAGLFFLWLDRARPAWAERHRIQRPVDHAGLDAHRAPDAPDAHHAHDVADADDVPVGPAVRLVLVNQWLLTLPALALAWPLFLARGLDVRGPPPPGWQALLLIALGFAWVEGSFTVVHRLMHRAAWFRRFHHVHHRYRRPTGIATHYAHPVDHLLGNLVPVLGGAVIVAVHPSTLLLWITLAVRNAIFTHGDLALPFCGAAVHHDFHHHDPRNNFGVVGVLDRLLATDGRYRAALALTAAGRHHGDDDADPRAAAPPAASRAAPPATTTSSRSPTAR